MDSPSGPNVITRVLPRGGGGRRREKRVRGEMITEERYREEEGGHEPRNVGGL